jgi:hypothetical protein|uniref:Uncharacterized protein n=1 Tax=Siphoviridae sp. ct5jB2 TaxID=2825337 RepID=A0A8S5TTQ1_9CAUD|nr:MAG TPA: hypothetical protein [Siphoviridae sp. ct5jB2]
MKVELKANGKTVQAEISEEQLKELGLIEERSRTGYERVKKGDVYYVIDTEYNSMSKITEFNDQEDEQIYNAGNYFNDKVIAENNARADKLLRCLRQWQALNDRVINWKNKDICKYTIRYDYAMNMFNVIPNFCERCLNDVYFTTREKAQRAINVFKAELEWYFTQYQQRLDEE